MSSTNEERPPSGKKRKIIHWNPDDVDRGQDGSHRHKRDWSFFGPLIFGLVFFGSVAFVGIRYVSQQAADVPVAAQGDGSSVDSPPPERPRFISRERLERIRANLRQEITAVRKVTDDHPVLIQNLVELESAFDEGSRKLAQGDYPQALDLFERVEGTIEDQRDLINLKLQSSTEYDKFLNLVEGSETARALAPYEYERAVAFGQDGEIKFSNGEFVPAIRAFERAIEAINSMQSIVNSQIAQKELAGKRALSSGDAEGAIAIFEEILRLQPDNEFANRNLERAEVVDMVVPLLAQAKSLEERGDLEGALDAYTRAFDLDSQSAAAQAGKSRVNRRIIENRYKYLIGAAEAAVAAGEWDKAIATYQTAVDEFPDREELQDTLERVTEDGRQAKIRMAFDAAYAYEAEYNWAKARESYLLVLDLDAGNEEAVEGVRQAGEIIRSLVRYETYLEESHALAERGEFQKAIDFYNRSMQYKPSYVALDERSVELKQTLNRQNEPVTIRFVSDGKTWVSIAGFEMLGRFTDRAVKIYPGNYRVRGRRKGYRDVLLEVRVRNGRDLGEIKVICHQPA